MRAHSKLCNSRISLFLSFKPSSPHHLSQLLLLLICLRWPSSRWYFASVRWQPYWKEEAEVQLTISHCAFIENQEQEETREALEAHRGFLLLKPPVEDLCHRRALLLMLLFMFKSLFNYFFFLKYIRCKVFSLLCLLMAELVKLNFHGEAVCWALPGLVLCLQNFLPFLSSWPILTLPVVKHYSLWFSL